MIPFTRVITVAMFAVLCFGVIVPLALKEHNKTLAMGIAAAFVVYGLANLWIWRNSTRPRS